MQELEKGKKKTFGGAVQAFLGGQSKKCLERSRGRVEKQSVGKTAVRGSGKGSDVVLREKVLTLLVGNLQWGARW